MSNVTALLSHLYEGRALQGSVLRHAVARAWVIAEHPELELPRAQWVAWFREIGFTRDAKSAEPPVLPLALYRGADPSHARNMAWTTDRHLASWFARRHEPQIRGRIYRAIVAPDALLAHLTGTVSRVGETEWIIDPAGILSFKTCDGAGTIDAGAERLAWARFREWRATLRAHPAEHLELGHQTAHEQIGRAR